MKKPSGKSGRRHLDDDEEADWDHAARTIDPLKKAKPRVSQSSEAADDEVQASRPRLKPDSSEPAGKKAPAGSRPAAQPAARDLPASRGSREPPISGFDRKKAKKLRSGQIEIEARIDLHGMRQDEAHAALFAFLARAQRQEKRWVLVITGKGRTNDEASRDAPFDMTQVRGRGVLKRNVPRWLEEAEFRRFVVSFTEASPAHGGEGALYIHLRKST